MADSVNCEYTREIVCPHCGHQFIDSWEMDDEGEEYCEYCGKDFYYERIVTVEYSSFKSKEDSQ